MSGFLAIFVILAILAMFYYLFVESARKMPPSDAHGGVHNDNEIYAPTQQRCNG